VFCLLSRQHGIKVIERDPFSNHSLPRPVLQDVIFSNQIHMPILVHTFWKALGWKSVMYFVLIILPFWYILWAFGILVPILVYFMAIWYFGAYFGIFFPTSVYCTKNLLSLLYYLFIFKPKIPLWVNFGRP
jgi:hypothetical protein